MSDCNIPPFFVLGSAYGHDDLNVSFWAECSKAWSRRIQCSFFYIVPPVLFRGFFFATVTQKGYVRRLIGGMNILMDSIAFLPVGRQVGSRVTWNLSWAKLKTTVRVCVATSHPPQGGVMQFNKCNYRLYGFPPFGREWLFPAYCLLPTAYYHFPQPLNANTKMRGKHCGKW